MKKFAVFFSAGVLCTAVPSFASTLCAVSGNIVANCGFENGAYTSTIAGNTNTSVPVSWTPSSGYDLEPGFNHLSGNANSGSSGVSIGNDDGQPVPTLSQTLTDVAGATYAGSLYVDYGAPGTSDTLPFFNVSLDGTNVLSLNYLAPGVYTDYTFSFVGTGTDVLSFGGNTSPVEWYVDDITVIESAGPVVPPPPSGVTPEPSSLLLLLTASGPLYMLRQRFTKA